MSQYPEIEALENILKKYPFSIEFLENDFPFCALSNLWIRFQLKGQHFILMVDDEYKDFELKKPAMDLCLVLRELEEYDEEEDILKWCTVKGLQVGDPGVLEYYRGLGTIYSGVQNILGTIDSQISYYDFELNAGAAQHLRKRH